MRRTSVRASVIVAAIAIMGSSTGARAVDVPWVNGDFELGGLTWTAPGSTSFVDADGDGDVEAKLTGCGEGSWQLSRGATKGIVPATSHLKFEIEEGSLDFYSFRMIILSGEDPGAWANNLLNLSTDLPTYDDDYWFDDQVLAWEDYPSTGPISGAIDLDPLQATAFNIDGWGEMGAAERASFLSTALHMTIVMYGCAAGFDGGATLDDFTWGI